MTNLIILINKIFIYFLNMSLIIQLIFTFLFTNIISNNEWVIQNAKSVICLSNETGLDFYTISSNDSKLMLRSEDAYGIVNYNYYEFENNFDDLNFCAILGGIYLENIIIFYEKYIQILNDKKMISSRYEIEPGFFRTTLKNISSSFIYISTEYKIVKIHIENKNNTYAIKSESKNIFVDSSKIKGISCDDSRNEQFYICSYFNGENYEITLFSKELSILDTKSYSSGNSNKGNYFNKIVFLKDNYKVISINSENSYEVRFRHLEIKDNKINVMKIYKEKNKEVEYIDINGTQLDGSYLNNDIISLYNDEIFKIYMKNNKILLSKFQFYDNDKILTVKTQPFEGLVKEGNNIHLSKRNNGIVIDFFNESSIGFLQIGHVKTFADNITNKNIFKITNYEVQSILKTKIIAEIEYISYDLSLLNIQENSILKKGSDIYPENDFLQIMKYTTNMNGYIYFQTKLIYEFPSKNAFQIFPSDEKSYPEETKIISLGNKGNISFYLTSCDINYYYLEESKICTSLRPEGYYFDEEKKKFIKCHYNCAKCLNYSNDDSNMQCLECKSGFFYNEKTFNCIPLNNYTPKTINIELVNNGFFWVFFVIFIIAIIMGILIICQDKIFGKCLRINQISIEGLEEKDRILEMGDKSDVIEKDDSNNNF